MNLRASTVVVIAVVLSVGSTGSYAQAQPATTQPDKAFVPVPRETVLGTVFLVRPAWDDSISKTVDSVREKLREEREKGKIICYVSIPLSSRGGGHRPTNVEISKYVKRTLEARYGIAKFWALAPGVIENELPTIDGKRPGGGEYLYMWTEILAGEDGTGAQFDMAYFVGPSDMYGYFGIGHGAVLVHLDAYISDRSQRDVEFRQAVADKPDARRAFIRYYGIRASATFSHGAHDEWNIFRLVNRRRDIGEEVAIYFDGRQVVPSAAEAPVRPGYEESSRK